jgi:L-lactate dehydrogenase
MKIGIIGAGKVGAACAYALVKRGTAREIVLVDRTRGRAKAVAIDMRYGAPLSPTVDIRDGDYQDIAGATLVMITAGINEKSGGAVDRDDPLGRLRLLGTNAEIYKDIVPRIVDAAPEAVLMIITDPPDALADIARGLAQHDRIVSSGTYLDSLRFRVHLAERLGVAPASVDAQILGEHPRKLALDFEPDRSRDGSHRCWRRSRTSASPAGDGYLSQNGMASDALYSAAAVAFTSSRAIESCLTTGIRRSRRH